MAKDLIHVDADAINEQRLLRGLTREELAHRAGVSSNRVRLALRGGPIGLSAGRRIARALRVRLATLLIAPTGAAAEAAVAGAGHGNLLGFVEKRLGCGPEDARD